MWSTSCQGGLHCARLIYIMPGWSTSCQSGLHQSGLHRARAFKEHCSVEDLCCTRMMYCRCISSNLGASRLWFWRDHCMVHFCSACTVILNDSGAQILCSCLSCGWLQWKWMCQSHSLCVGCLNLKPRTTQHGLVLKCNCFTYYVIEAVLEPLEGRRCDHHP